MHGTERAPSSVQAPSRADEGHMKPGQPGETCLTGCLTIGQFIDAAAGRDPYICQRAVDAVTKLAELSSSA